MRTVLIDKMNRMVQQIAENEKEILKLNIIIKEKKQEIEKKRNSKQSIPNSNDLN